MAGFRLSFTIFLSFAAVYTVNHARTLSETDMEAMPDEDRNITVLMEDLEEILNNLKSNDVLTELYDVLSSVKKVDEQSKELTRGERNILADAYNFIVGERTKYRRILNSIEQKEEQKDGVQNSIMDMINDYKDQIEETLNMICTTVLDVLDNWLLQQAASGESKVFYYKAKGDYYWYKAELTTGKAREYSGENAVEAYKAATDIATTELPPTHPVRLGLALSLSVFYYEFLKLPDLACRVANAAVDDAIVELDTLSEESYPESTLIMQQLRDNLAHWTCDMKEDTEEDSQQK